MKFRTGFVTNSSSANYAVTLRLDGIDDIAAELETSTYDFLPWYRDTDDGCEVAPYHAMKYTYHTRDFLDEVGSHLDNDAGSPYEDVRELCRFLLSSIREYGVGLGHNWWRGPENERYFECRWARERLLATPPEELDSLEIDLAEFDREDYFKELKARGKMLRDRPEIPDDTMACDINDLARKWRKELKDNICRGWNFVIVGTPRLYADIEELASYIVDHGGTVEDHVSAETDFVIYCDEGQTGVKEGDIFWTFQLPGDYEHLEYIPSHRWEGVTPYYQWCRFAALPEKTHDFYDYYYAFEDADDLFGGLFDDHSRDRLAELGLAVGNLVIPEHEFVRRFDPDRDKNSGMPFDVAHPIIVHRFAQICLNEGLMPRALTQITYDYHISTFGDSTRELGFLSRDEKSVFDLEEYEEYYDSDEE